MRLVIWLVVSLGMLLTPGGWDGQTRFTILEHINDKIQIKSFDPQSLQGTILLIPPDLEIESLAGRGAWPAKNIFRAGTAHWASGSIIDYLGLSYVGLWDELSILNKIAWAQYQNKVAWVTVDLAEDGLTQKVIMPDGQTVLQLNPLWFDQAKQLFASQDITTQHLSLSIINTTDATGLGSHAADVAESMGFKVDAVTDDPNAIQKCRLEAPVQDVAIKALAKVFDCDIKTGPLKMWLGDNYKTILR